MYELPGLNDQRWKPVIIRVKDYREVEILTYPDHNHGYPIASCYTGDLMDVIKQVRYEQWIAARVGYKVGWLDITNINFTLARGGNSQMQIVNDWLDPVEEVPEELLTSEIEAVNQPVNKNADSKDLNRIVRHLKNLFGKR